MQMQTHPAVHPHKPLIRRYPSPGWSVTRDFVGPFRSHLRRSQSGPGLVAILIIGANESTVSDWYILKLTYGWRTISIAHRLCKKLYMFLNDPGRGSLLALLGPFQD